MSSASAEQTQQQGLAVSYEVSRDRFYYRFENPSSFDTPELVPHDFKQKYWGDNHWVAFQARYKVGEHLLETEFAATPQRTTRGDDFDTFYQPSGDVIMSGTTGNVSLRSWRVRQNIAPSEGAGLAWHVGYQYRRDRSIFHPGTKIVSHTKPASSVVSMTYERETTTSETHEVRFGARRTWGTAPGWRTGLAVDLALSPALTVSHGERWPSSTCCGSGRTPQRARGPGIVEQAGARYLDAPARRPSAFWMRYTATRAMRSQQRKWIKQKQRQRRLRERRQRQQEQDLCDDIMIRAQLAWQAKQWESVRRNLEKVVRIRPGHSEARRHLAELSFFEGRLEEGLAHYDQAGDYVSTWPPVIFMAAQACWTLGRFEHCHTLAGEFLSRSRHDPWLAPTRATARRLRAASRKLMKIDAGQANRAAADVSQPSLFAAPTAEQRRTDRSADRRLPPAKDAGAAPAVDLPPFPELSIPDIRMEVDVDREFPRLSNGAPTVAPVCEVLLRRDYAWLRLQKGFDELLSLAGSVGVEHFWYQLETVRRILRDFRGRVLLADEVGLGKTIEACLALREYWVRGLARKVLILTPPSLVDQWVDELQAKFGLAAVTPETGGYLTDAEGFWGRHPLVVASLALARQPANRARLATEQYDLVIVDEAHYLKNRSTAAWQLVNELKKRFLFLLSATPVGNNLAELYNLILLLRPGLLSTEAQFRRDYGRAGALDEPVRRDKLRELLREVMVRNTRAHIDLRLPRRLAATCVVQPSAAEADVLERVATFVRDRYAASSAERHGLMMLQMQAGSSVSALARALERYAKADGQVDAIRCALATVDVSAKTRALVDLLKRSPEKTIVFTNFIATLNDLRAALESAGFRVAVFHGGLTAAQRGAALAAFQSDADLLVSSHVGGEGRNLQFCRTVVNYDLPWNPMAIEQRVGRVHRIGQRREVYVFNLCLAGSVEQHILSVLHEKLNLFELVAGEMEMILGELDTEVDFASLVMDLWARAADAAEREQAFEQLGERLGRAKARYDSARDLDRALFQQDYEV